MLVKALTCELECANSFGLSYISNVCVGWDGRPMGSWGVAIFRPWFKSSFMGNKSTMCLLLVLDQPSKDTWDSQIENQWSQPHWARVRIRSSETGLKGTTLSIFGEFESLHEWEMSGLLLQPMHFGAEVTNSSILFHDNMLFIMPRVTPRTHSHLFLCHQCIEQLCQDLKVLVS